MKLFVCAVLFSVAAQVSSAATSCSIAVVSPVSFGVYDVFSTVPNDNGVGSLTVDCQGSGNTTFVAALGDGRGHGYAPRVMRDGEKSLNYNLYTDATRSVVWGDGSGGSQIVTFTKNKNVTMDVFGRIPAGQDVPVGTYTDNITATVTF
jgi:spore coat protein U-like protein